MNKYINESNVHSFLKYLYYKTSKGRNKFSITKLARNYNIDQLNTQKIKEYLIDNVYLGSDDRGHYWKYTESPNIMLVKDIISYLNKPKQMNKDIENLKKLLSNIRLLTKDQHTQISIASRIKHYNLKLKVPIVVNVLVSEDIISVFNKGAKTLYYWKYNKPLTDELCTYLYNKCKKVKDFYEPTVKPKSDKPKSDKPKSDKPKKKSKVKTKSNKPITKEWIKSFPDYDLLVKFLQNSKGIVVNKSITKALGDAMLSPAIGTVMRKANMFATIDKNIFRIKDIVEADHIILAMRDYWKTNEDVKDILVYDDMYIDLHMFVEKKKYVKQILWDNDEPKLPILDDQPTDLESENVKIGENTSIHTNIDFLPKEDKKSDKYTNIVNSFIVNSFNVNEINDIIDSTTIKDLKEFKNYNKIYNFIVDNNDKYINTSISKVIEKYGLESTYGTIFKKANMLSKNIKGKGFQLKPDVRPEHFVLAIRDYWRKDKKVKDFQVYDYIYKQILNKNNEPIKEETVVTTDNTAHKPSNNLSDILNDLKNKKENTVSEIKELENRIKELKEKDSMFDAAIDTCKELTNSLYSLL